MEENKELKEHITALGEWASRSKDRVAFVVCGEFDKNNINTHNSLVGTSHKLARALYGNAKEDESFEQTIMLAALMLKNPVVSTLVRLQCDNEPESEVFKAADKIFEELFKEPKGDD